MYRFKNPGFGKTMFAVTLFFIIAAAQAQDTGTISPVKKITIHSKILNEGRTISIYSPPAIEQFPGTTSPVIYLLDGELVSEIVRSQVGYFCEIWRELPPITVVGIENLAGGKPNRINDLTPNRTGGNAENFLRFMQEEVMPLVEKDHKKAPYRILVGSSLAGYFTVNTFLNNTEIFDAYIASSPSLHRSKNEIMKGLEEKIKSNVKSNKILFLAVGNEPLYLPNVMKLDSLLKDMRLTGFRHGFVHYPTETHGTTPLKSYYDGFRFIFRVGEADMGIPLKDVTIGAVENYYGERSYIFRAPIKPSELIINQYGYKFLYDFEQPQKAVEFFKRNVENYPQSSNVYDSYAEGLLAIGDRKNALVNYEKSLQLDPKNKNAEQQIARLKKE